MSLRHMDSWPRRATTLAAGALALTMTSLMFSARTLTAAPGTAAPAAGALPPPAAEAPADADRRATASLPIEEVAPGVHAVIRPEPLGLANHGNTVFIVNEADVVVVDSPFTRQATHEVIDALRRITNRPVSFVINTHWHDDHTFGNQVWRDEWPGVTIVSTGATRSDMLGVGAQNRASQVEEAPGALAMVQAAIDSGVSLGGTPMSGDERAALTSSVAIFRQYLAEIPDFRLTPADLTFDDRLTLIRGRRVIEVIAPGGGVTAGDAVVWLPADSLLIAGDLVDVPFPYTYRSRPGEWIASLERLAAMRPRIVVPGHGPVQTGIGSIERLRVMLSAVRQQVAAGVSQGQPIEEIRKRVRMDEFEPSATGGGKMLTLLFRNYFVGPAIGAAFGELKSGGR